MEEVQLNLPIELPEMNSSEYVEMSNQFKELYNEKDKEVNHIKQKYLKLYKTLVIVFGLVQTYTENYGNETYIEDIIEIIGDILFNDIKINGIDFN